MTFLAALRCDRLEAPWLLEGPIDGESFRLYLEKVLLPTLRPGDIVFMDNLGSHKGNAARQLIRSAGAKLFFLPKYSPSSSTCCEKPPREPSRPSASPSTTSLRPSHPTNAPTTSQTQVIGEPKIITL